MNVKQFQNKNVLKMNPIQECLSHAWTTRREVVILGARLEYPTSVLFHGTNNSSIN